MLFRSATTAGVGFFLPSGTTLVFENGLNTKLSVNAIRCTGSAAVALRVGEAI